MCRINKLIVILDNFKYSCFELQNSLMSRDSKKVVNDVFDEIEFSIELKVKVKPRNSNYDAGLKSK